MGTAASDDHAGLSDRDNAQAVPNHDPVQGEFPHGVVSKLSELLDRHFAMGRVRKFFRDGHAIALNRFAASHSMEPKHRTRVGVCQPRFFGGRRGNHGFQRFVCQTDVNGTGFLVGGGLDRHDQPPLTGGIKATSAPG